MFLRKLAWPFSLYPKMEIICLICFLRFFLSFVPNSRADASSFQLIELKYWKNIKLKVHSTVSLQFYKTDEYFYLSVDHMKERSGYYWGTDYKMSIKIQNGGSSMRFTNRFIYFVNCLKIKNLNVIFGQMFKSQIWKEIVTISQIVTEINCYFLLKFSIKASF